MASTKADVYQRISDDLLQQIKDHVTCRDYLESRGEQPGKNRKFFSQWREERTPSLSLFDDDRAWKDFGDDRGGDVIALVEACERVDFREAVRILARMAGIAFEEPERDVGRTIRKSVNKRHSRKRGSASKSAINWSDPAIAGAMQFYHPASGDWSGNAQFVYLKNRRVGWLRGGKWAHIGEDGAWRWGKGNPDAVLPLYVPARRAPLPDEIVVLAEGHPDTDRVHGLQVGERSIYAVSKPMSSVAWRAEWLDLLRGHTVHVIPDSGESGQKYGRNNIVALTAAGIDAALVQLPTLAGNNEDVSDWLDRYRHTDAELFGQLAGAMLFPAFQADDALTIMFHGWRWYLRQDNSVRGIQLSALRFLWEQGAGRPERGKQRAIEPAPFKDWLLGLTGMGVAGDINHLEQIYTLAIDYAQANRFPATADRSNKQRSPIVYDAAPPGWEPVTGWTELKDAEDRIRQSIQNFYRAEMPGMVYRRVNAAIVEATQGSKTAGKAVRQAAKRVIKEYFDIRKLRLKKAGALMIAASAGTGKTRAITELESENSEALHRHLKEVGQRLSRIIGEGLLTDIERQIEEQDGRPLSAEKIEMIADLGNAIKDDRPYQSEYLAPSYVLAEQTAKNIKQAGNASHTLQGLTHASRCARHEEIDEAIQVGATRGLYQAFCRRDEDNQCPHRRDGSCPGLQIMKRAYAEGGTVHRVHSYLATGNNSDINKHIVPDLRILDETVSLGTLASRTKVSRRDLDSEDLWDDDKLADAGAEVPADFAEALWRWAFGYGCRRGSDGDPGWSIDLLRTLRDAVQDIPPVPGHPHTPIDERRGMIKEWTVRRKRLEPAGRVRKLFKMLVSELEGGRLDEHPAISITPYTDHGVSQDADGDEVCDRKLLVHCVDRPKVGGSNKMAPLLCLDATADERIAKRLFSIDRFEKIRVRDRSKVTQIIGAGYSKWQLGATDEHDNPIGLIRLADELKSFGLKAGDAVVVNQVFAEPLRYMLPAEVTIDHFNNLRGSNKLETCNRLFIVGAPVPTEDAVESLARGLYAGQPGVAFHCEDFKRKRILRPFQLRDGRVASVLVRGYDDERIQQVHDTIVSDEITQVVSRLRGIRHNEKEVFIFGQTPVAGIETDRIRHRDLIDSAGDSGRAKMHGALLAKTLSAHGILFHGRKGRLLDVLAPEYFASGSFAADYMRHNSGFPASAEWGADSIKSYIESAPHTEAFQDLCKTIRWMGILDSDLQHLGAVRWRQKGRGGHEWRRVIYRRDVFPSFDEFKAYLGQWLTNHGKMMIACEEIPLEEPIPADPAQELETISTSGASMTARDEPIPAHEPPMTVTTDGNADRAVEDGKEHAARLESACRLASAMMASGTSELVALQIAFEAAGASFEIEVQRPPVERDNDWQLEMHAERLRMADAGFELVQAELLAV